MRSSKGLTFIMSDKCNITCDFCGPDCGPGYKIHLDFEFMRKLFDEQHRSIGVSHVVFTGGEPTLFIKDVLKMIEHVSRHNLPTRIVTNAYWGKSKALANRFVSRLKRAGLSEFNFSVDDFHEEYIPLSSIKTAVDISLEAGINVLLVHKTYPGGKSSKQTFEQLLGREIVSIEDISPSQYHMHELMFSNGITMPIGRGSENIDLKKWTYELPEGNWRGPCSEVFKNITIQANGKMSPCCGIVDRKLDEFYCANMHQENFVDAIKKANQTVLYNWLALEGPSGIMEYVENKTGKKLSLDRYIQNCQVCQQLFSDDESRRVIKQGLSEKITELQLKRAILESNLASAP